MGERTGSFAIFLFCGLLPWLAIHEGLVRSATAITDNAALVSKLRFPAELLVLAVVVASLLHEAIAAVVFLVILAGDRGNQLARFAAVVDCGAAAGGADRGPRPAGGGGAGVRSRCRRRPRIAAVGLVLSDADRLPAVVCTGDLPAVAASEPPRPLWWGCTGRHSWGANGCCPRVPGRLAVVATLALVLGWWCFRRLAPEFADEL